MPVQLDRLLRSATLETDLAAQVRRSPAAPLVLEALRQAAPDLTAIPQATYTLYREFEHKGAREGYERVHFARRTMLSRAVLEMVLGDDSMRGAVHDLLWSICEETSWVLPAHEEQGPDYWDLRPPTRTTPLGAHTALTREPDAIDLFAAETGASLAETLHLVGERLAPEVRQRVRQEVARRIFGPYLAYARRHWWHKGALNWNGVCNGAVGLAFLRLEHDAQTLAEALGLVLEGFEAYIATGFEADGGSIEGVGYWNYGLMYYVALAEILRERTSGALDLLGTPRLRDIARYPLAMALSPGRYVPVGDATELQVLAHGMVQRLAERTGFDDLRGLLVPSERHQGRGVPTAKLAIVMRDAAWWDGTTHPFPPSAQQDAYLPEAGAVKFLGQVADGRPVALAAIAGHNDGHHSHTDVGSFIYHLDGESLLCDPGRGRYSRKYFRQARYDNLFCNSLGHSVPRIGGRLQAPGPEWNGQQQYHGRIVGHGGEGGAKQVTIEFHEAYDLPALTLARRTLRLQPTSGKVTLEDEFGFAGDALEVEEALVTWGSVEVGGATARITGARSALVVSVLEPALATWEVARLEEDCRANHIQGVLTRLTVSLPAGTTRFRLRIVPGAPVQERR